MTLASSGQLSIGDTSGNGRSINVELGRTATTSTHFDDPAVRSLATKITPSSTIKMSDFYSRSNTGDPIWVFAEKSTVDNTIYISTNYSIVPTSYKTYIKYASNSEYLYDSGSYTGTDINWIAWSGLPVLTNLEYIRVEFYFANGVVIQTDNISFPLADNISYLSGKIYNDESYPYTTGLQSINSMSLSFLGNGTWTSSVSYSNMPVSPSRNGRILWYWNTGELNTYDISSSDPSSGTKTLSSTGTGTTFVLPSGIAGQSSYAYSYLVDYDVLFYNNFYRYHYIYPQLGKPIITYNPGIYYPGQVATISTIDGFLGTPNFLYVTYSGVPAPYTDYYIYFVWNYRDDNQKWLQLTASNEGIYVPVPTRKSNGSPDNTISPPSGGSFSCYIVNKLNQKLAAITSSFGFWPTVGSQTFQYYPEA